jgi:Pyridoxamine 5'-phosphate oxidase
MAHLYEEIGESLRSWIARQPMFFVATAPLAADGHVNVSPKGPIGSLRVLGPRHVAYLDVGGSGAETIAHVRENGRIVVMLCSFEGPPRILRLHGTGEVVLRGDERFEQLLAEGAFEDLSVPEARRAIIDVQVERIADSCGYGVPLMDFEGMREHHALSTQKKLRALGVEGYLEARLQANGLSIDGLAALEDQPSHETAPLR